MVSLRLLSVNARDVSLERGELATLIACAQVDVACVHGAPSRLRWRSRCAALGRESGLVVVTGGRTGGGNLVLSTLGVEVAASRDVRLDGGKGLIPHGGALAAVSRLGSPFTIAAVRFAGESAERRVQLETIQAATEQLRPGEVPSIVCVDTVDAVDASAGAAVRDALATTRAEVGAGIFVDHRFGVTDVDDLRSGDGGPSATRISLTLPG